MRALLFLSLALAVGCDGSAPTGTTSAAVEGSWEWVRAVDVQTREVHTPQTEGYEATLTFAPSGEREGTYRYARLGGVEVRGRYGIGYEHEPGADFLSVDAPIDFLTESAWLTAGGDTLYLGGVMELGYEVVYVRERVATP